MADVSLSAWGLGRTPRICRCCGDREASAVVLVTVAAKDEVTPPVEVASHWCSPCVKGPNFDVVIGLINPTAGRFSPLLSAVG